MESFVITRAHSKSEEITGYMRCNFLILAQLLRVFVTRIRPYSSALFLEIPMKFNSVCLAALSLSALSLFACGQKGDSHDIWLMCDATETALSMSESSGLGQSADDVLAQVDGSHSSTAVYDEDLSNTAGLTVTLSSSASEATFMDQSVNGGGSDTSEDSDATPGP